MLRHDVDHSLDVALELAWLEHELGLNATYFLLPGSSYWGMDGFTEKVKQLADFGHEVGLHFNGIAQWYDGRPIVAGLREDLEVLRGTGVPVSGISVHGDPRCYEHGFINYWCFSELMPPDAAASESGLSAEGVATADHRRRIAYPPEGHLIREDGGVLDLWSIPMADFGLEYEAMHLPVDRYFSDSGGTWLDGRDPAEEDLSVGRIQILMHPEYYRGEQRRFWFLGPARSGTKWLARLLDSATSLTVTHESTFNNTFQDGEFVADHLTGAGFSRVATDVQTLRRRVVDQLSWIDESVPGDYGECNVYLPFVLEQVGDLLSDDVQVGLIRDPWRIVLSLLERDWYDVPDDPRHPAVPLDGWDAMEQVERIAWYVRLTQDLVRSSCDHVLDMDGLFRSPDQLVGLLRELGIAFYPRLVGNLHAEIVDATDELEVAPPTGWHEPLRERVASILDGRTPPPLSHERSATPDGPVARPVSATSVRSSIEYTRDPGRWLVKGCNVSVVDSAAGAPLVEVRSEGRGHAHVVLGGSSWRSSGPGQGQPARPITHVRATWDATVSGTVWVFALMYGSDGGLARARRLVPLGAGVGTVSFRVRPNASKFDVALYFPVADPPASAAITSFRVDATWSDEPPAPDGLWMRSADSS